VEVIAEVIAEGSDDDTSELNLFMLPSLASDAARHSPSIVLHSIGVCRRHIL
jgi:hypothetical protein